MTRAEEPFPGWDDCCPAQQSAICRRCAYVAQRKRKLVAFAKPQVAELGFADAGRIFQHRLEYRLQLAGRAGDDLQHFGGRGLLLQRLGEIVGALAQLVEQPRVLDGDDGLGGEVLHQLDLLVGERPDFLAEDGDGADQLIVLEHRHVEQACDRRRSEPVQRWAPDRPDRPHSRQCGPPAWSRMMRVQAASRRRIGSAGSRRRYSANAAGASRAWPQLRNASPSRSDMTAELGLADAGRILQHGLEHRLQFAWRAGDDLAAPRRSRSAAPATRVRSSVRWRSSLSSRVFSMAMTACAAKFCTSSICLSVNGRTSWR